MPLRISTPDALRLGGGIFMLGGLAACVAALTTIGSGTDTSTSWAVLGGFCMIVGTLLFVAARQVALEQEVERIRSLGTRVAATVTEVSERDEGDDGVKAYLHATWRDPQTERTHALTSQSVPRALARSYRPGDPVVVFIDPADPQRCHFELAEQL